MITQIIKPSSPGFPELDRAAEIIRQGGLVIFPTETVYGLGGDATNANASKAIYTAKGRPSDNPLIIHIAKPEDAERYAVTGETYYRLAKAFMPGPLTVIMSKKDIIPYSTTGGLDSVAVRCPSHPIAHALIEKSGVAIAAPSANLSGSPSPTCADHVIHDMDGRVDMIIDGGECEIGLESTIVKIDTDENGMDYLTLLRPGGITYDALCCVCTHVEIAEAVRGTLKPDEHPLSPGMKYRHYAPHAPLALIDGDRQEVLEFFRNAQKSEKCAVLCYDEEIQMLDSAYLLPIGKEDDLETQAHLLFARLREADLTDVEKIYAHLPAEDGLGLALYNRMIRAAAHTVIKLRR